MTPALWTAQPKAAPARAAAGASRGLGACLLILVLALLAGCAASPPRDDAPPEAESPAPPSSLPWYTPLATGANPPAETTAWVHQRFPGKRANEYRAETKAGRSALRAESRSAISALRKDVRVEPADLGRLRFSWLVPELIADAEIGERDVSDSPVRIVLVFDGDRTKFSARDAMLSELAHTLTGEPMPYATLMYVWSNTRAAGTVIPSPRTGRIRKLVVESGATGLNRWLDYERDVRADFLHAFGEEPGALLSVGLMSDSDNTRSAVRAWYGPVKKLRVASGAPLPASSPKP